MKNQTLKLEDTEQLMVRAGSDLEACTELGKRMIIGDRAPHDARSGVGYIVKAAEKGGGEALSVLSVLFALGIYVRQDLGKSLNSLRLSAINGWLPARSQLLALAGSKPGDYIQVDERSYWTDLVNGLDLDFWQQAPQSRALSESPKILAQPEFLPSTVCDWLMEKARHMLGPAMSYNSVTRETEASKTRTNSAAIFNLVETDLTNLLIQQKMSLCTGVPFRHFEAATVLHYSPGEQITEHYDFIDPDSPDYEAQVATRGQRIITFLVYLNAGYEGGTTDFPELGISFKGSAGSGIYFENAHQDGTPDTRTLHAGRPPETGEKWVISQFIRNRPVV